MRRVLLVAILVLARLAFGPLGLERPAAAQAPPPAPQLEDRFGGWAIHCTIDPVALFPSCVVSTEQVSSVYLWLGQVREPWLRFSGIGLLEALDCRLKFHAAAASRVTPATSRLLSCQAL
jgi:hypothetical protein